MIRKLVPTSIAAAFALATPMAHAQPAEISSALSIARSTNKNQVHYAVQVDDACAPAGNAPVHAYWRMLEKSPDATEPLGRMEERGFGIGHQDVGGADVHFTLRGLPARPITIHTQKNADGTCSSSATATISGAQAHVSGVFVKMKLFGVDYVQLTGTTNDGVAVRERVSP